MYVDSHVAMGGKSIAGLQVVRTTDTFEAHFGFEIPKEFLKKQENNILKTLIH